MTTLETIEQEHQFEYPALYKQLDRDGMLSWGKLGPGWYATEFPRVKDNPPFLLFANDFEIIEQEDISREVAEGMLFADKTHRFVPLGYTGAGDWYAFYYNLKDGDDVPIVLVYHDSNEAVIMAKNLQDFIFARLLETLTEQDPEYPGLITEGDQAVNAGNYLRTHSRYLSPRQQEIAAGIYAKGVITEDELRDILEAEIGFDWLDSSFPYQTND
ncbi:SMI1/KNR4 family protein [Chitinophaga varians]|uniref:SMI1/KNR4 family protein n=1 Tax=Chitinophaga varians TaxID=2202339 RepID=A0A847RMS0_9BACT|nr:SMI1/KNR4 family protein [Chitinophaga varians]NLR64232.1 SMI1/KNR4 family protein [Chitinophaga varians]